MWDKGSSSDPLRQSGGLERAVPRFGASRTRVGRSGGETCPLCKSEDGPERAGVMGHDRRGFRPCGFDSTRAPLWLRHSLGLGAMDIPPVHFLASPNLIKKGSSRGRQGLRSFLGQQQERLCVPSSSGRRRPCVDAGRCYELTTVEAAMPRDICA